MSIKSRVVMNENAVVIGLQFGDEGKGKVVDLLSNNYDIVARFQGGDNAGHTIVIDGVKYKLSLIPSGVFHGKKIVLGAGVVINPYKLLEEIEMLNGVGINLDNKLFISDNASLIFSIDKKLDVLNEKLRTEAIGTTGRGIGVCYSHRVARIGLRVCDIFCEKSLEEKLKIILNEYNALAKFAGELELCSIDVMMEDVYKFREILKKYVVDSGNFFHEAGRNGENVMFEGAQGCGLDVMHGTYPFVTSSSTFSSQVASGAPIPFREIGKIYGILKAYSTRVGNGIFVVEDYTDEDIKDKMCEIGQEFGTVTSRERRCGWLDLFFAKHYARLNCVDSIVLTKLDVLDSFEKIKVCIGYEIDGKQIDYIPSITDQNIVPIYHEVEGWSGESVIGVKNYSDLPKRAREYVEFIEKYIGVKIEIVSNGPDRSDVIYRV